MRVIVAPGADALEDESSSAELSIKKAGVAHVLMIPQKTPQELFACKAA